MIKNKLMAQAFLLAFILLFGKNVFAQEIKQPEKGLISTSTKDAQVVKAQEVKPVRPDKKVFDTLLNADQLPELKGKTFAILQLYVGKVAVFRNGKSYHARQTMKLGHGDSVRIFDDAKARILLSGGDFLHIPGNTMMGFEHTGKGLDLNVWSGSLIAYLLPRIQGRSDSLQMKTSKGLLSLNSGKVSLNVNKDSTKVTVFENQASWKNTDPAITRMIKPREILESQSGQMQSSLLDRKAAMNMSNAASPEFDAASQGILLYNKADIALAKATFLRIQKAFPYNGASAYYLGLLYMNEGDDLNTIRQWKHFVKIDPKKAEENKIPQHLTVLIAKQIKDEIDSAIANEAKLGSQKPEPGSVAVAAFSSKGIDRYKILSKGLTALLISDLAKVPELKILERQKIQKLVDELKLTESGLVDKDSGARMGKMMKAEKIIIGEFEVSVPQADKK